MISRSSGKKSLQKSLQRSRNRKAASRASRAARKGGNPVAAIMGDGSVSNDADLSPRQKLIQERAAIARRKENLGFIIAVVFLSAFMGAIFALLLDPKKGAAVSAALICLALSFKYPRPALYTFIIYIPFAGTVIYALGGSDLLQIAKDAFYIPAAVMVFQFCRKNRLPFILPRAIKPPLLLLGIVVGMTILFTNLPDQINQTQGRWPIIMAIWGAKLLFGYIPVVTCIYYLIRNRDDLLNVLRLQTMLVLIACGLGLMQYLLLVTNVCEGTTGVGEELFRASLQARCLVGGSLLYSPEVNAIRLPGTFVAPWQWGWFLISAVFFSFGTTFGDRSPLWRGLGIAALVGLVVMAFVSGQRIALFTVPLSIIGLMILTGQIANLKRLIPIGLLFGLILAYLAINNPDVVDARINSFFDRWAASPPQNFIAEQFDQVWNKQEGIFGHGVGRATNSARTFGRTILIETYHPKLIYEIGPIGLASALLLYFTLTAATFRAYRRTKDPNLRSYAASMWVFVLFISICPYYYPLDVDPVGVYYWLAAGILLKIPEIERQETLEAAAKEVEDAEEEADEGASKRRRFRRRAPTFS